MPTFLVKYYIEEYGSMEVEAEDEAEARSIAEQNEHVSSIYEVKKCRRKNKCTEPSPYPNQPRPVA